MNNTTLGYKIKSRRKELGLTQKALAGDKMTRNMLSLIEADKAMPSFSVCEYLASELKLPLPFLFSGKDDLTVYRKQDSIPQIKQYFKNGSFELSLKLSLALDQEDDELSFIIYKSALEVGKQCILRGLLHDGYKYLTLSREHFAKTAYAASSDAGIISLYISIAESFQSPMLEFDRAFFENEILHSYEVEFYKYLTNDLEYDYSDELMRGHIAAKRAIKANRYIDAKSMLENLIENKSKCKYNAFVIYSVYADMENVYRQLSDYEGAYRFSTKRISLLNAFNS